MKKRFSIIICICLLLSLCAGITYAKYIESLSSLSFSLHVDGTNVPERIEVTKAPDKTDYTHGEDFERDGMEVTVHYTDGTSSVVTNYDITDGDSLTAGQEEVTISYTENGVTKETTTSVTVTYEIVFNAGAGQFADGESANAIHCYKDGTLLPGSNSYQEPSRNGCVFAGWYKDADCSAGNEFDPTNVSANGTVYAKWELIDYTITYESNGGSAIPAQVYNVAGDVTLADAPVKEGYTFIGWKLSTATENWSAETYAAGEVLDAGKYGDITLSAQWTANTYSVEYNANGGTGTMEGGSHTYDKADNLADNAFTRPGYTFLGWSTSSTATTPEYTDGQSVSNLTSTNGSTVILYAVWGKTVEITQQPADQTAPLGTTCNFSVTAEGDGLTYEWYYINPGSTTATKSGITSDTYTIKNNADTTVPNRVVYCVITDAYGNSVTTNQAKIVATYEVSFDANGGTGDMDRATHIYGESKELTANNFTRPGYAFKGWNTAADGSGTAYADNASVKNLCFETSSITLYAQWERIIPEFAESNTWYKGTTAKNNITSIQVLDSYTPDGTEVEKWDASSKQNGSLTAYVLADGQSLVIAGNGSGTILANENSSYMFSGQYVSTITGLELVDTSAVTSMYRMFDKAGYSAATFDIGDLSEWDTSNVTDMSQMFYYAGYNATTWNVGDLSEWDTGAVTNMSSMFTNAGYKATTWDIGDLSEWDTGAVTNMSWMFSSAGYSATAWNVGDLSNWDTSAVTNMSWMFSSAGYSATAWDIGDLSGWDTSKVTNMSSMFEQAGYSATTWNVGDLSKKTVERDDGTSYTAWNTAAVTSMNGLFRDAGYSATTWNVGDLSEWDTSNVTDMSFMFAKAGYNAEPFALNLAGWDTSKVSNMDSMFANLRKLKEITVGEKFSFTGNGSTDGYLPTPDPNHITRADGNWYNVDTGEQFIPTKVPSNVAATYVAYSTSYSITYDSAGGSEVAVQVYSATADVTLADAPNKEGYVFAGWKLADATGNWAAKTYSAGEVVGTGKQGNITLIAQWELEVVIPEFAQSSTWYKGTTAKSNITSIQILDSYTADGTEVEKWDASSKQNGSLMAYVLADGKTLVIAGNGCGTILANENSSYMFSGGSNSYQFRYVSSITGLNWVDTSNVTNMSSMFNFAGYSAQSFALDLSEWDTSKVTDMSYMFSYAGYNAQLFELNLAGWNTGTESSMNSLFYCAGYNATTFDIGDLGGWDTSKVTDMGQMFCRAGYKAKTWDIGDLSEWDTSKVTNMSSMFENAGYTATTFDIGDLGGWDTSAVTNMRGMFYYAGCSATAWNVGDLSEWVTSNVATMSNMFNQAGCKAKTWNVGDLSEWVTSKVTNMSNMFYYAGYTATTFDIGDLGEWDTSKVTNMSNMFYGAGYSATTWGVGDLSEWDTSKVTSMIQMFYKAGYKAKTWDIGDLSTKTVERADGTSYTAWDTSKVTTMSYMFYEAGFSATTWDIGDLSEWDTSKVSYMTNMFGSAGYKAKTWDIGDLSEWDTSAVTDMSYMFYNAGYKATTWDIGDLSRKTVERDDGTSYIAWDTSKVTSMERMFSDAGYSATTWDIGDLSEWDTSAVTNMESMFGNAGYSATTWDIGDLSEWDTSKVTNMSYMFQQAGSKATTWDVGDLGGWDTSKVTNMKSMFYEAGYSATTWDIGDLSEWVTSAVTDMSYMFENAGYNATTFNIGDLGGWDTSAVTNMSGMFQQAGSKASYTLDLSNWDVGKVTRYSNFNYGAESKVVAPAFGTSAATLSLKRPAAEVTYRNPLTGETRDSVYTRRPYAVVINNITEALPQHGVNNAAMIYEMLTEGGVTRCLAIYDDISSVGTVGSIRSARTYLVDLAQAYDAILVHAGASSVGANALNATGISHLDALGDSGSYFYRDQARIDAGIAYEHTLFSTGSSIVAYADALGITQYRSAIDYGLQFADAVDLGGSTATNIHIQFSGVKNTSLAYSEAQGLYYAYQNGASYEDGNGGAVTFKNVLVLRALTSSDAIDLTGSGDGYFACGGQMVEIRWQRESASAPFSYTLADGTPISLGVGSSYIAIVPMDASVTHQ